MARKKDGLHPILILLGLIVFIIAKIVDFIADNIIPILIILGFGAGIFLVYYLLKQRNKQKIKSQPNKKSTKQINVPLASTSITEEPKPDNSEFDIIPQDIDLSIDESETKETETTISTITNKEDENIVKEKYNDSITILKNDYSELNQSMTETVDEEIKSYAKAKYPHDSEMQEYTYKEQLQSKISMSKFQDTESIRFAQNRYPDDYSMQVYTYQEQVASKKYMSQTNDQKISEYAAERYPEDYSMQEYTYKEQVKSKAFMKKASNERIREYVEKQYPLDYSMQEYIYKEQIALNPQENASSKNKTYENIIDVNSENLDLSIDYPVQNNEVQLEPPYWGHTYVYSYDEIKYASPEQKRYYSYFKKKVSNGEIVDIQGYTNYAFILYFDFLNEYENHRDIKLLEEQFKLLGQICPKTKSYSLMSLQDLLRKRTDSYSLEKLNNLQEPSYQFEHGYSDYDPDAYKLGKQYKDKLDLNKQEVAWLNKFWNPSNVFISIEGCCIATIKQYLLILSNLNKKLKPEKTSISKEVDYFKEKIFEIKEIADSYWGYYDKSYMKQRVESEIYLTVFKRVENSVREIYGHKRKVGNNPYYEFEGEFENRIGRHVDELVDKYKGEIVHPDIETQIELNAQNVNRWKTEFTNLKDLFQKNEIDKFIEGVIALEETNQKNPNIENIFFEASKFIAKYDKVQSLKYYAKYIYYDLKSVKFDNKELTKTVQKSLFKSQEQINDFKRIIAELIETSDIEKALGEISKIFIPKRKKIQLDKSKIKEVERKHDGTVELLNEYLETETDNSQKDETFDDEGIEINIITPEHNNSIFIADIRLGKVQEELVMKFITNSFAIHQDEVDKFAIDNGMFKNQLIDSINEACSEHLDGEPLIEEDDENYVIEESYFKEIAV
jgi:hypothetical protein